MAVVIETTIGDITIDLFIDERPQTCKNFLKLCKIKYYNFCLFHSVQANFIAQTGDPTGLGTGGESVYGLVYGEESRYYEAEKLPKIKHNKPGLLSMVNYGNNMLGSQFFVTLGTELKSLEEHCVFAEVTEGHDILIKLNDAICDNQNRPYQDIRITHTVILEDPFDDLPGLLIPDASPDISSVETSNGRIGADEKINDEEGLSESQLQEIKAEREAKARATILEIVGDLPHAEVAPPENVLFVCKLNPVTTDEDLELIFGRYGKVKSCEVIRDHQTGDSLQYAFVEFEDQKACEQAYLKMDNVLIDDRRIHVDFSQSVSKYKWRGKGLGVQYFGDKVDEKDNTSTRSSDRHSNKRDYYKDRERDRDRDRNDRTDRRRDEDRRRRGTDRDDDYRRRERRKVDEPRRREEESSWRGEEERWDDERKRRDIRDERRRDDDRKYSSRRDDRRREEDRRRDIEKRRNGSDKKESNSRRTENVGDKKSEPIKNKELSEKSPKQDVKLDSMKYNHIKQEVKHKDKDKEVPLVSQALPPKPKEEVPLNTSESKTETEDSKLSANLDITPVENSTDTTTLEKTTVPLKEKKKRRRKTSSSSDSTSSESTDSSSSSSSLDFKRKHKRKLTVAKKYYHRGKLVKVIKKKRDDSSDSESSDESSDSDHRKKKRKYKKIVKVIKKRRHTTSDESESDTSSSEDSDSSRPRKKKKKNEKNIKRKKKDRKRHKKKKRGGELSDSSNSEVEKYKKKVKI